MFDRPKLPFVQVATSGAPGSKLPFDAAVSIARNVNLMRLRSYLSKPKLDASPTLQSYTFTRSLFGS